MTEPVVRDLVDRALLPLKAVDAGLYHRAVDYVVDDGDPEVLLEIAAFGDGPIGCLLLATSNASYTHWYGRTWRKRLQEAGISWRKGDGSAGPVLVRRDALYRSDAVIPAQWVRLGRLLAAVLQTDPTYDPPAPEQVPGWVDALLMDVMFTVDAQGAGSTPESQARRLRQRRLFWDAGRLAALLRQGGVEEADAPAVVLLAAHSNSAGQPSWRRRLSAADLPGVTDYLTEHATALPGPLLDGLRRQERHDVLTRMAANPRWAAAGAHLVAAVAAGASKELRREAIELLEGLDAATRAGALAPVLAQAPASRCRELVEFLARTPGGAHVLTRAAEENRRLADLVSATRARHETLDAVGVDEPLDLPPFTPLEVGPDAAPVKDELRPVLGQAMERAAASQNSSSRTRAEGVRQITEADLDELVAVANGRSRARPALLRRFNVIWVVRNAPSLTLAHALRLHAVETSPWCRLALSHYTGPETDPRAIEDLMARLGGGPDAVERFCDFHDYVFFTVDPEASWPWYAEHLDLLRERLMDAATAQRALEILTAFPRVPAELLPAVADAAVGPSKASRPLAQAALRSHPRVRELAEQGLAARTTEVRTSAAAWVGSLARPESVPALRTALGREKRDVARAALLVALEDCGGDMTEFLSPRALGAEAAKGLKGKVPASLSWLDPQSLPAVRWKNGDAVDSRTPWWWVVLADKMKNPSGRGLINLYLSLLEPADAAALAAHVTRAWIAQDTAHPSAQESRAHAQAAGRQRYDHAQRWLADCRATPRMAGFLSRAEAKAAVPLEERVAQAYAEHQRTYVGSAIADKGLLAFAVRMDGGELAGLVRSYMRDNPGRRAQFEALVHALAANGKDTALQVLLSIARRHKMAGIQAAAAALAQEAADERGWSADELADRTIPTAGFDPDGLLHLSYGDREFTGRLAPDFKIVLSDAGGKARKSLPAPRVNEDPEVVKEARKQLSVARKDAKAVLTLQSARLYEAMCAPRTWRGADWRALLAAHPLVGRLVSRLIWTAAPGGGGEVVTFRPTEDGALIGADDAEVTLADDAVVGLAHGTALSRAQVAAWRAHLADYEVEPLFDQLTAAVPRIDEGQKALSDLQGHVTDTFTFRAAAAKRGYQRGDVVDAGTFHDYVKEFPSSRLTAVLGFTGSWVPEESMPCATTSLSFRRRGREVELAVVPPVLLAECYADYRAMAALGSFDPDWRKNASPW